MPPISDTSRDDGWKTLWLKSRHLSAVLADLVVVVVVYFIAFNFRYNGIEANFHPWTASFGLFLAIACIIHLLFNQLAGVYAIVMRYMSLAEAVRVIQAGVIAVAAIFVIVVSWPLVTDTTGYLVPRAVVLGGGLVGVLVMVGVRFTRRILFESRSRTRDARDRALLVGAGQTADMILREILRTPSLNTKVVGLVDDSPELRGRLLQGIPVLGGVTDIPDLVEHHHATQVIVAIPTATPEEIARVYRESTPAGVPIKILPSVAEFVAGRAGVSDARELEIQDLLGRGKIETDIGEIHALLNQRSVLVTGAGGSIGSELCMQIAAFQPERLILVDHDESSLYNMHERLQSIGFRRYQLCPTSILRKNKMDSLFEAHRPHVVYHAAAYKHVPLMELSPDEAILNNIKGTLVVAETAARHGSERMISISTDKAVEPVNVMGATKRAAELIMRMMANSYPDTLFACVRFGNVLGSQGSVIPIFREQIKNGGPVIITHPDMTRFFMLLEEAVQLVLQATIMLEQDGPAGSAGLNTFVLNMGEPVSIVDLAQQMIEFYWKDQSRPIGVEFAGLRPGEKLDERLVWEHEFEAETQHPFVRRVCLRAGRDLDADLALFEANLTDLIRLASDHGGRRAIKEALIEAIPGYAPLDLVVDKDLAGV